jgi:preprotein translocase subunit SecY
MCRICAGAFSLRLGMLAVYRLGAHVGAPGINKDRLDQVWHDVAGTLLGVLDLFSGGNFRTISFSLSASRPTSPPQSFCS